MTSLGAVKAHANTGSQQIYDILSMACYKIKTATNLPQNTMCT